MVSVVEKPDRKDIFQRLMWVDRVVLLKPSPGFFARLVELQKNPGVEDFDSVDAVEPFDKAALSVLPDSMYSTSIPLASHHSVKTALVNSDP